jgi:hypothetical protein
MDLLSLEGLNFLAIPRNGSNFRGAGRILKSFWLLSISATIIFPSLVRLYSGFPILPDTRYNFRKALTLNMEMGREYSSFHFFYIHVLEYLIKFFWMLYLSLVLNSSLIFHLNNIRF